MVTLLRQGLMRIGGSVLQRTHHSAVTSPAVAAAPSRKLSSIIEKRARQRHNEQLLEEFKLLKPHQVCWELIKLFPARKVFNLVAIAAATVTLACAGRSVKEAEKKRHQMREEAEQVKGAEKKREQ
ncbi:uncharacterized protein LOC124648392 [Lolium rigidum]|uniref:uncharacterized protein LOC124648392 n=1 Tax=Lolium rigidum TaxID=89674 RepID=UPI001F5C1A6C|nr:uncharacterized protein LOC124648392 [Lolium rigidum]